MFTVAEGYQAGQNNQQSYSVAIGYQAGQNDQGITGDPTEGQAVAIGYRSGQYTQGDRSIAIGDHSGQTNQHDISISIGSYAGNNEQSTGAIAIGLNAGYQTQGQYSIAIGLLSGQTTQGENTIAIGVSAGYDNQQINSIAIGTQAGYQNQGITGDPTEGQAIAIGYRSGQFDQGDRTVAIGDHSGQTNQHDISISIGSYAGNNEQSTGAIAIGPNAGQTNQGEYSIAIGNSAGQLNQYTNSIAINATPTSLNTNTSGLYISPIYQTGTDSNFYTVHYKPSTKEVVYGLNNSSIPGIISVYAGSSAPTGYFICDGSAVSRYTYGRLFAVIGTTYGVGDGVTTFNIPNLKGRIPVGLDASQTEFDTLNEQGGAKTHTLTIAEMPSHNHSYVNQPNTHQVAVSLTTTDTADDVNVNQTTGNTGGDGAHNNLQPYIVLNYIISY